MARGCNCAGSTCGCTIQAGAGITVTGIGTAADPFVVTAILQRLGNAISFQNSATVNWTVVGTGTPSDPLQVSAAIVLPNPLPFPQYTTAGRPSAATAGVGRAYYDTTLGKPGWSNGSAWKDAAGTTI